MTVQISAFSWVPDIAKGFVKDLRIRWALEESGREYDVELVRPLGECPDSYRQWQPFGQVPAYRDGEVEMFESGAIVLHIARGNSALEPADRQDQARMTSWVFAALSTIEPRFQNLFLFDAGLSETPKGAAAKARLTELLGNRLEVLTQCLGSNEYLLGKFSAADIMMATVLRDVRAHGYLNPFADLNAYVDRCEARPAFARALAAQLANFEADNA